MKSTQTVHSGSLLKSEEASRSRAAGRVLCESFHALREEQRIGLCDTTRRNLVFNEMNLFNRFLMIILHASLKTLREEREL